MIEATLIVLAAAAVGAFLNRLRGGGFKPAIPRFGLGRSLWLAAPLVGLAAWPFVGSMPALQGMTHTFEDGAVVQVRPQDMGNFQTAIAAGQPQDWVLQDNSVRNTTVEELQAAVNAGVAQGKAIWDEYANKVTPTK